MINIAKINAWVLLGIVFLSRTCEAVNTALIIIDVQNCFLPGGSLAVPEGEAVIPVINNIRQEYGENMALTVFTQDWHCPDHVSFGVEHAGNDVGEVITLQYDASGALCQNSTCVVAYNVDSYSGFFDNGGFKQTELDGVLKSHQIQRVIITGLAFDYCVSYSSQDAASLGYETYVVEDATKPIADSSARAARADMESKGVKVIQSRDLGALFQTSSSSQFVPAMFSTICITILLPYILTEQNKL